MRHVLSIIQNPAFVISVHQDLVLALQRGAYTVSDLVGDPLSSCKMNADPDHTPRTHIFDVHIPPLHSRDITLLLWCIE